MNYPKIGIRPIIDGRRGGIRESLEEKTMAMAHAACALIEAEVRYADGQPAQCVVAAGTIGGAAEAAACAEQFARENVCATLSVTPCWCYGSETMDLEPMTIKAIWGFNGTERPGAVYLAAAMAAHNQKGLPAFAIYGHDVQDQEDNSIPGDVRGKIVTFARCALAVGQMRNRSYVSIGGVSMGIMGSYIEQDFMQKYLGIRPEWVDMSEVHRRVELGVYDEKEFEKARDWFWENCPIGWDKNAPEKRHSEQEHHAEADFVLKMALICRDILRGNPKLNEIGRYEEALGRNGIAGGFQGQRMWSDWLPIGDFTEAILNTTFDWNGKRQPVVFATENDSQNGITMLFQNLLTGAASVFADVRTYWSPEAVERVTGWKPEGSATNGFIHLINSGAAALDATGMSRDKSGTPVMKPWWEMEQQDIDACLGATDWCPADLDYFRGGGFSSHFRTRSEMPVTLARLNIIDGLGPVMQIAEGQTVVLPSQVHETLEKRTDPTWPTTWFTPRLTGEGVFRDVYTFMSNWGANHGTFTYGHIGAQLATMCSMLRIPVSLHNLSREELFRPQAWQGFGTQDVEGADYRACQTYGPLYR